MPEEAERAVDRLVPRAELSEGHHLPRLHVAGPGGEVALVAVGDASTEEVGGVVEAVPGCSGRAKVGVGPRNVFVGVGGERKVEAALQEGTPFEGLLGVAQRRTDVVQRMHLHLTVAQRPRESDRPPAPALGCLAVAGQHAQL